MCRPPTNNNPTTRRVVIAGAGPAGLLLQALLHHRNKSSSATSGIIYDITLIESRDDLGQLNQEELQSHRSWMIGLAGHGLEAVRSIPGLYENYLSNVGVKLTEGSIFIGSKKLSMGSQNKNSNEIPEGFIVDRNFIVAALARYAKDNLQDTSEHYTSKYNTELLYVDSTNQRVLIRSKTTNKEEYIPYDLLVGADGIRSTVREALVKRHYDFELHVNDIFNTFKAVHIQRPACLSPSGISFLPGCLPNFNGIVLPETGNLINLSMGVSRNHFESGVSADLKSDDPKVVAAYFKENFKAFQLEEEVYLDWATQWVNQRWNRTGQVHCNKYSSLECKIVLMGDSAHATSPSIGMGMNTALRDAQKLFELLEKYDDDLEKVLPQYTIDRVPEGNALSDIALNLYCFDTKVQMKSMLKGIIRSGLHYMLPNLIDPDPQTIIGTPENTMADVYQMSIDQGTLNKHRVVNDRIRQEFFEKEVGMVKEKKDGKSLMKRSLLLVGIPVLAAYAYTVLIGGK